MTRVLAVLLGIVLLSSPLAAQEARDEKPSFAEPKKDWKWDEDKRFDFLMERLASLEASLDAVNAAIAKASGKKNAKQGNARRAEAGNSAMDRKGGGPMKWNEFYGTTAEKFFYHPVDPNTTYHTSTVLSQVGTQQEDRAGESVQGNSGVPVHQRPPQFDYIYRANRDAKERAEAEAAEIQGQLDALNKRREKLEAEQADLWCRLAFRAIQRRNIPRRPELRFRLVAASPAPEDESRAIVTEAAARFLVSALSIIDMAEDDQALALGSINRIVESARRDLDDTLVSEVGLVEDVGDRSTSIGQFVALSQLLDDTANNLSESYEVAIDGGQVRDLARKEQFRGLLQRSLIEYAEILLALDESICAVRKQWNVTVDTKTKSLSASQAGQDRGPDKSPDREAVVEGLTSQVWYWHWENEDKRNPRRFTADGGIQVPGSQDGEWLPVDGKSWKLERRWVIEIDGNLFVPVGERRYRGTYIHSPRALGLFADPDAQP